MSNKPFDQRIINPLERPSSKDLNLAQSQLNANVRAFARSLIQNTLTSTAGSLGTSFIVSPNITAPDSVYLNSGMGFADALDDLSTSIGGILGLDNCYKYAPTVFTQFRTLEGLIANAPLSGPNVCRRDVIAIRARGVDANGLTDLTPTDVYSPAEQKFSAVSVNKTLTSDLTTADIQFKQPTDNFVGDIVYSIGTEGPWSGGDPDQLLGAPIHLASSVYGPYLNIAIINRYPGQTSIAATDIVDYRSILSPQGTIVITGSATVGSVAGSGTGTGPGAYLANVNINAPAGIKCSIWKVGNDTSVEEDKVSVYGLAIAGARGISKANISVTVHDNQNETSYAVSTRMFSTTINTYMTYGGQQLYLNPAKVSPTIQTAIGQPLHLIYFTVGVDEVYVSSTPGTYTVKFNDRPEFFGLNGFSGERQQPVSFTVTLKQD